MLRYIIRRMLGVPFLLLGVASVAFILSQSTKGDPLSALVPERMMNNPEIVNAVRAQWGLDQPLPVRYVIYMKNLVQGDMGTSFNTRRPVARDIAERLPATLELVTGGDDHRDGDGHGDRPAVGPVPLQHLRQRSAGVCAAGLLAADLLVGTDHALHLFGSVEVDTGHRTAGRAHRRARTDHRILHRRCPAGRRLGPFSCKR